MSKTFTYKTISKTLNDDLIDILIDNMENKIFYDDQNNTFQYNPETRLYESVECIKYVYRMEIRKQILTPLKKELEQMKPEDFDNIQDYIKQQAGINQLLNKYSSFEKMNKIIKALMELKDKNIKNFYENQKPYLLPLSNNKNIDLRTGEMIERTKNDFFTFCIDATYTESMNTTKAERFFNSLMSYDKDKIDALQQTLGAIITGELLKFIFVFFGPNGDNGKTELCNNILKGVLGQYHRTINQDIILSRKFKTATGPQPHMFSLKGGRCGIMSEINEEERIDEMMFKKLSGGDTIETRNHHDRKTTEFINSTKPIFLLNKPFLLDTRDKATLERMVNIEFSASFKKDPKEGEYKQDPELIQYLKTPKGRGEILNWIVKGSIKFYGNGMKIDNDYIKNATKQFVSLVDPVNGFMKSVRFSPSFTKFYSRADIVIKFKSYLTTTPHKYNNKLKDAVYQEIEKHVKKVKRSLYGYRGLDIKEDYELDDYDNDDKDDKDNGENTEHYNENDAEVESLKLLVKEATLINEDYKNTIDKLLKEKEIMEQKIKDMEDKLHTITITKDPIENSDKLVFEEEEKITTKKKDKKHVEELHYSKMKVKELRAYCKKTNVKVNVDKMKKKDIIYMLDNLKEDVIDDEDFDDETDDFDDEEMEESVITKSKKNIDKELSEDELFDEIEI